MSIFLMTWNPDNKLAAWGHDSLTRELLKPFNKTGHAEIRWKLRAHKHAKVGDDVVLMKQGNRPTGIFAFGQIIEEAKPMRGSHQVLPAYRAKLRITAIVDPAEGFMLSEYECREILGDALVNCRSSGQLIPPDKAERLTEMLRFHAKLPKARKSRKIS